MTRMTRIGVYLPLAVLLLTCSRVSIGQTAPARTSGFNSKALGVIDLGPEIEGLQGRVLRMAQVTLDAGGATAVHDHVDRPEIIYVLQGRLTETRSGQTREYGPGETIRAGKDTQHWVENRTSEPVLYLAVSVAKP
jgi:quercetin dioxygenase-like cupin family protein